MRVFPSLRSVGDGIRSTFGIIRWLHVGLGSLRVLYLDGGLLVRFRRLVLIESGLECSVCLLVRLMDDSRDCCCIVARKCDV